MDLKDEAELNRCLDGIKNELVNHAEALVTNSAIASNDRDFGKRQMSNLLEIASAERSPAVIKAWMKGQIGKAKGKDGWGTRFGSDALKAVDEVIAIAERALGGLSGALSADQARNELQYRALVLYFGYARWHMLYAVAENQSQQRDNRRTDRGRR